MKLILGDCIEKLKELPDNSVDSIVTDPPYELGFMNKKWDNTGIANNVEMWSECLRVLKPGGHLLAFSGTRTYHRMASAIEDAGFEVRDMIEWVYGSGFPKSYNIANGIEGKIKTGSTNVKDFKKLEGDVYENQTGYVKLQAEQGYRPDYSDVVSIKPKLTTELAQRWEGWGTALKPAHEPICMARKPLSEKTVAENCLKWGTGGINIDDSRVEATQEYANGKGNPTQKLSGDVYGFAKYNKLHTRAEPNNGGRFPANLIHDGSEEVRECFPETNTGGSGNQYKRNLNYEASSYQMGGKGNNDIAPFSGNASRFFKSIIYQAKASKKERNKGCEGLEEKYTTDQNKWTENDYRKGDGEKTTTPTKNNHPTVKPIALMEYLIKLVTLKGGTVLDPFMGSGTTGIASKKLGYDFIGIEKEADYIKIAKARIDSVQIEEPK